MKFTAVGDILPQKRIFTEYDGFEKIKEFIANGDTRFFNLETTLNRAGECYASQFSGGTYLRSDPKVLGDIEKFGFNMTTANNNHSLDFSYKGLEKTIEALENSELVHAGIGNNLQEASAPAYLDTKSGRVALVSVCTTFEPCMMAGEQSKRTPGRPGINGVRISKEIVLPKDAFEYAKEIGEKSGINAGTVSMRSEGYLPPLPDGVCEIGLQRFVCGEKYGVNGIINEIDKKRLESSVREASLHADYVILSIHTHDIASPKKEDNPPYIEKLAHDMIDFGADAVICHGPHLLRPIEVYKERPIFYSLGDFVLQLYDVPYAPEDFYSKYGLKSDDGMDALLEKRSGGYTRGLMEVDAMLETVIPFWETNGKKLKSLKLMPIKISRHEGQHLEGLPKPASDVSFMEKLKAMCKPYGVDFDFDESGAAVCRW